MSESISEVLTFLSFTPERLYSEVTRKRKFHHLQKYCKAFELRYLIGQNNEAIPKLQSLYKVHLNTISNGELSDPLCDIVNRDLT